MIQFVEREPYYVKKSIALVIGCGDMGVACARVLGKRRPLLVVDIDEERLQRTVASLRTEGHVVTGAQCDIADAASVGRLSKVLSAGPGVQVLAHVAAVGNTPEGWRKVMNVDLLGVHLVMGAVLPQMVPGGAAILISSTGAYHCKKDPALESLLDDPLRPNFLDELAAKLGQEPNFLQAYYLAKQGMNRLAQQLAIRWGHKQIRVLSVSPGLIDSVMGRTDGALLPVYDGVEGAVRTGTRAEKAVLEVPLERQGTVPEVAAVVEFLASDAASFVTGIDIPIDGGSTAFWRAKRVIER